MNYQKEKALAFLGVISAVFCAIEFSQIANGDKQVRRASIFLALFVVSMIFSRLRLLILSSLLGVILVRALVTVVTKPTLPSGAIAAGAALALGYMFRFTGSRYTELNSAATESNRIADFGCVLAIGCAVFLIYHFV